MMFESEAESLKRRLAEAEENLQLIAERKSEYVQQTDIPLQLIKDERRIREEIEALREQLAGMPPPREKAPLVSIEPRVAIAAAGVIGLVLLIVVGGTVLSPFSPTEAPESLLEQVGEPIFPGSNVRGIQLTEDGVLVLLDREGLRRVGGQGAGPGNPGGLLMAPLAMAEGADGRLWVGTLGGGLVELAPEGKVGEVYSQTAGGASIAEVTAVAPDAEGGVWVGTSIPGPGVYSLNAEGQWHTYPWEDNAYVVYDIALDDKGQVWFATAGGGVRCLDPSTGEWKRFDQLSCAGMDECLPSDYVFDIHIAVDGLKWVGTAEGLAVLDDQGGKTAWRVVSQADGLPHAKVSALAGDAGEYIFAGTKKGRDEGGLAIVDAEFSVTKVLTFGNGINVLAFDPARYRLWVGTLGGGLSVWSREKSGQSAR